MAWTTEPSTLRAKPPPAGRPRPVQGCAELQKLSLGPKDSAPTRTPAALPSLRAGGERQQEGGWARRRGQILRDKWAEKELGCSLEMQV